MSFPARLAAILLVFFAFADGATAQSRRSADLSQIRAEAEIRDRVNAWTIGLAGGLSLATLPSNYKNTNPREKTEHPPAQAFM